ncbi:Nif11 family protein (plasmid) [Tolypothrix sp. PCC 7910]|uniref:Nif11-like leader peptide family natural product precursor n=1 Tax=Tolypothrix sp. PCC 7910 TaxID=2099387 RepID=UPI0014277C90|nr:Nif11-like leader peptide family natural product precursor [Tolypothrix sp. PCC 7910]QIR41769.1 Nif11 family protein [Tolypothrix sp. PCC 7910]
MDESLNTAQSQLQVMEFFATVLQDKELLNRLMQAMAAKDNAAMITIAAERGYNFSQESLHQGLTKIFHLIEPIMQEQNLAVSKE